MRRLYNLLIIFCCIFLCFHVDAQNKYDHQWYIGAHNWVDPNWINKGPLIMDFNFIPFMFKSPSKDSIKAAPFYSVYDICDPSTGKMIVYSNGCRLYNGNWNKIIGTDTLGPGPLYDSYCQGFSSGFDGSFYPVQQNILLLPYPGHPDWYFHFIKTRGGYYPIINDGLNNEAFYTVVDMSKNNGEGEAVCFDKVNLGNPSQIVKVCPPHKIEFKDITNSYGVQACKHANGEDWWIIVRNQLGDGFNRILLTKNGVQEPIVQHIGGFRDTVGVAQAVFSPDGRKYAFNEEGLGAIWLFDFDRKTGLLSNLKLLPYPEDTSSTWLRWIYPGISFSPSGKFLYANAYNRLYQWDVSMLDINGSRELMFAGDKQPDKYGSYPTLSYHQLVPDGRIFILSYGAPHQFIHVIDYPNLKFPQCNFKYEGIEVPVQYGQTGPNWPHYRMPPDTTTSTNFILKEENKLHAWYNQLTDEIQVNLVGVNFEGIDAILTLNSSDGKIYKRDRIQLTNLPLIQTWSVPNLSSGVYIVTLTQATSLQTSVKLIISKK